MVVCVTARIVSVTITCTSRTASSTRVRRCFSCCCYTCGIRKPTEDEGGWLSANEMLQCFCLKAAANLAIDLENIHYTLWRCEATGQLLDLKYEGEETPGQCTKECLCLDVSWAGQVCFCVNCAAAGACGKVDGMIEHACNFFCLSYVCMLPVGTEPHNNPFTCGLCTVWFAGEPTAAPKAQNADAPPDYESEVAPK